MNTETAIKFKVCQNKMVVVDQRKAISEAFSTFPCSSSPLRRSDLASVGLYPLLAQQGLGQSLETSACPFAGLALLKVVLKSFMALLRHSSAGQRDLCYHI